VPDDDRPLFQKPLDELLPPDPPKQRFSIKDTSRRVYDLPARELVAIARLQKWLLITFSIPFILFFIAIMIAIATPREGVWGSVLAVFLIAIMAIILGVIIARIVFMILLAVKLFQPTSLALLIVLEVICGLGVVTLLIVNARATATLRRNDIRVGFFGAKVADLPKIDKRETTMPKLGW
jgi:hypothetical protein